MKTWFTKEFMKATAALLVVFAAGAGTGYLGGRKHAEYKYLKEREAFSRREMRVRRTKRPQRFMNRLERDLNLNPAQRAGVNRVLERHYERIRDIRSRMRPRINSIMQEIRQDVRSFLDADQQKSFDSMVEKLRKKRAGKWRKHKSPRPGDPAGARSNQ